MNFLKTKKGVTLVELLVAIAVISSGIVGIFGMLSSTLRSADTANAKFRAAYFAKEGIEMVRYIRDTNAIQERVRGSWINYGNYHALHHSSLCGSCCEIPWDFKYGDGIESCATSPSPGEMVRQIQVNSAGNYIEVFSTVIGETREGEEFSVTAKERIYNYR